MSSQITDSEIEQRAELASKQARESIILEGRHENERRALAEKHKDELTELVKFQNQARRVVTPPLEMK